MALSKQTLEPLQEAQGLVRASIKSAAANEDPAVVHMLSKILSEMEQAKEFDHFLDMMKERNDR